MGSRFFSGKTILARRAAEPLRYAVVLTVKKKIFLQKNQKSGRPCHYFGQLERMKLTGARMRKTSSSMLKLIVCMYCVGKSLSIFLISSKAGDGFEILFRQNNACEASCRTTSIRCCAHREQCLDESCAGLLSKTWSNQSAWSDWSGGQSNAYESSCRITSVCCYVHREQCLDESCAGLLSKKLSNQSVWSDWSGMLTKEFELSPQIIGATFASSVCAALK